MEITIDKAGRLVIPKRYRERFNLVPGARLEIEADAAGLRLRPAAVGSLRRKRGLLIHSGDGKVADLDIAQFVRKQREARSLQQGDFTEERS